uniref:C2H2-type domain-containing protein n=1 Tax=Bursaphelenchus xylophilus TaxID=6326 RepID=A0A1I7SA59_BURXY
MREETPFFARKSALREQKPKNSLIGPPKVGAEPAKSAGTTRFLPAKKNMSLTCQWADCGKEVKFEELHYHLDEQHCVEKTCKWNGCGIEVRQNTVRPHLIYSHTTYRPAECSNCDKKFHSHQLLKIHEKVVHNKMVETCLCPIFDCVYTDPDLDGLQRHAVRNHGATGLMELNKNVFSKDIRKVLPNHDDPIAIVKQSLSTLIQQEANIIGEPILSMSDQVKTLENMLDTISKDVVKYNRAETRRLEEERLRNLAENSENQPVSIMDNINEMSENHVNPMNMELNMDAEESVSHVVHHEEVVGQNEDAPHTSDPSEYQGHQSIQTLKQVKQEVLNEQCEYQEEVVATKSHFSQEGQNSLDRLFRMDVRNITGDVLLHVSKLLNVPPRKVAELVKEHHEGRKRRLELILRSFFRIGETEKYYFSSMQVSKLG